MVFDLFSYSMDGEIIKIKAGHLYFKLFYSSFLFKEFMDCDWFYACTFIEEPTRVPLCYQPNLRLSFCLGGILSCTYQAPINLCIPRKVFILAVCFSIDNIWVLPTFVVSTVAIDKDEKNCDFGWYLSALWNWGSCIVCRIA